MRLILAFLLVLAGSAAAEPAAYRLDAENSLVAFGYTLSGQPSRGRMPVAGARIILDFDRPSRSTVDATLDPTEASAGLFFATQAMKGLTVLDTQHYPTITFRSKNIRGRGQTADVDGLLTIRDVTLPVRLQAQIYRPQGANNRDRLSIRLRGEVSRSAFGASGFPDLVGDTISLDILARIEVVR